MSLGGYKRIRTIGKGAFGKAILYCKIASETLVVIKEVNLMELTEPEKQMALNEVEILSSLCHPNIIQYLGSFEVDGVLMIEMEYADGGTLAQIISQSSQLKELEILLLFSQCVAAIEYIHNNFILHRDLKTANVFLTKNKLIKVGDFGISKIMTTRQAQTVVGTPYYISPEMCEGKQYDTKSDVWALGCILHEMACLHKTFHGENLSAVVHNIMKVNFVPLPCVYSEDLKRLVTSLLQKDPSLRPNASELMITVRTLLVQAARNPVMRCVRSVLYQVFGNRSSFACVPIPLPPRLEIMQVAASKTHYITVSRDNVVHTWGEGKHGQLGHGEETTWLQNPTVVQSLVDKEIVEVGAGDGFSVFLSGSGALMTCGNGTHGCLGQGDLRIMSTPQIVPKLLNNDKIKQIACGDHHCAVLTQTGELFTWGRGQWGQLGTGFENNCDEPVKIKFNLGDTIKSVHCGPDCTAVITGKGCLYVCGCNKYGKLGLVQPLLQICGHKIIIQEKILRFRKSNDPRIWPVVSVSLGSTHSAALTECGQVITMGSNTDAQLGHNLTKPSVVAAIDDKKAKHVSCGPTYTIMTSAQNVMYFWGTRWFSRDANTTDRNFERRQVTSWPEEILALYASPTQITQGEILSVKHVISLSDGVLLLVDTTVPLILTDLKDNHIQNTDHDSFGSIPKWISAELAQAKHSWDQ